MRTRLQLLGARFEIEGNSRELLQLALAAFGGLPPHRLLTSPPRLRLRLLLTKEHKSRSGPPSLVMFSGDGLLGGASDVSSFIVTSPREQAALVIVPARMLRFPYHVRYELIEFAAYTLAARVQGLVPLHGACVGSKGRGILLLGASGAGKSTLALQCLLQRLDFLSEDSLLVEPRTLLATGASNFIHVRSDSLRWVELANDRARIRKSPVIRRRSGVRKFEVDLRKGGFSLARQPLRISAIVFLSPLSAGRQQLLAPLPLEVLRANLAATQPYGAVQEPWPLFLRNALQLPAFELRRGGHPRESVEALRELLRLEKQRHR